MVTEQALVVSFHDLHPGTRTACECFLAELRALGIARVSLLVVPRWHGGEALTSDRSFATWLCALAGAGHEICLHGFEHRVEHAPGGPWQRLVGTHYTDREGEFYQVTREGARERVCAGLALLTGELGLHVDGFTPPAWLLSDAGRHALVEAGLVYSTRWSGIELLQSGEFLPAPTLVWSSRSRARRLLSRGWVRAFGWWQRAAPVLRIAVHPHDLEHPAIAASIRRCLRDALAAGRAPLTYRELLAARARAVLAAHVEPA